MSGPSIQPRTYVLDTCVLLADPRSVLRFEEHDVVLPLVVIEELDRQESRMDEVGANARAAIRLLEELGASKNGGLATPQALPAGGRLRIELNSVPSGRLPDVFDATTPDHRLLAACLNSIDAGTDTVLVTKDAALRIKGAQLGSPSRTTGGTSSKSTSLTAALPRWRRPAPSSTSCTARARWLCRRSATW